MRAPRIVAAGALFAALAAQPVNAQNVIWFEDDLRGTSSWAGGMGLLGAALPGANIYSASSTADFFAELNGGGWDLAIFGEHNFASVTGGFITDLSNYLSGGGLFLGATWRTDTYMGIMDAGAGSTNGNTITDNGSPFYSSIWGVSPISLTNPGWGTYSRSYSALNGAACVGSLAGDCAAILGNGGKSLLLGPLGDAYANAGIGADVVYNSSLFLLDQVPDSTVPEPATMTLLATGLAGMAAARRRKQKS